MRYSISSAQWSLPSGSWLSRHCPRRCCRMRDGALRSCSTASRTLETSVRFSEAPRPRAQGWPTSRPTAPIHGRRNACVAGWAPSSCSRFRQHEAWRAMRAISRRQADRVHATRRSRSSTRIYEATSRSSLAGRYGDLRRAPCDSARKNPDSDAPRSRIPERCCGGSNLLL